MRHCKFCNIEFKPTSARDVVCESCKHPKCKQCGQVFTPKKPAQGNRLCSTKCKYDWIALSPGKTRTCCKCKNQFTGYGNQQACKSCQSSSLNRKCKQCGGDFVASRLNSPSQFCGQSCSGKWKLSQPEIRAKIYTNERLKKALATKRKNWKKNPEAYAAMRESLREGMAKYMGSLTVEQKAARNSRVSQCHKASGHRPKIRGGNGTGPTQAETALTEMFPHLDLKNNYPVKTGMKNGSGYPTCYKVDVALPSLKFGIEADGNSHGMAGRKEQDAKKVAFLSTLGWVILRITNKRILQQPKEVKAEIESVLSRLSCQHS